MAKLRKLGRRSDHRMKMLSNQVVSLIKHKRIVTSVTRAKETRRLAEKMITLGKAGDLHSRRQAIAFMKDKEAVAELFSEVAPKYSDREGGYTRILKLGPRRGDGTEMVILELV